MKKILLLLAGISLLVCAASGNCATRADLKKQAITDPDTAFKYMKNQQTKGDILLFWGYDNTGYGDIFTMDKDGSSLTNVTNTPSVHECDAFWTDEEGIKIVYMLYGEMAFLYCHFNVDTNEKQDITRRQYEELISKEAKEKMKDEKARLGGSGM